MSGMQILERIMEINPATDVIMLTAHDTNEMAVEAMRKGAADYFAKPAAISRLRKRVSELLEEAQGRGSPGCDDMVGIVGKSAAMRNMFSRIRGVAPHYQTVVITGETGTGKELVARAIHDLSPVAKTGRFVVLNCSAVVETLFESELFGHVKGSFTDALSDKPGLFEHAHGGTLFLDEIGDMPLLERYFVERFALMYQRELKGLTNRAGTRLARHSWPGNVRELENVLGHAAMMTQTDTMDVEDLPAYLLRGESLQGEPQKATSLEQEERHMLIRTLAAAGGNHSQAARLLRIGRDALRYKVKKHNLRAQDLERTAAAGAG